MIFVLVYLRALKRKPVRCLSDGACPLYPDWINAENTIIWLVTFQIQISNSNFKILKFKTNFSLCRFLLQNVFLKLINIFVYFVFILVDAFSGSIKTEKTQKIFLPRQKIISAKENFRALAWTLAKFCLREQNGQSRAGSVAPSCQLG